MQISAEAIMNNRYERFLNSTRASRPIICLTVTLPSCVGGVSGSIKLSKPKRSAVPAVSSNMLIFVSKPSQVNAKPAAIQPMVPSTLMAGNSFCGSLMFFIAIVLVKASVGKYVSI